MRSGNPCRIANWGVSSLHGVRRLQIVLFSRLSPTPAHTSGWESGGAKLLFAAQPLAGGAARLNLALAALLQLSPGLSLSEAFSAPALATCLPSSIPCSETLAVFNACSITSESGIWTCYVELEQPILFPGIQEHWIDSIKLPLFLFFWKHKTLLV